MPDRPFRGPYPPPWEGWRPLHGTECGALTAEGPCILDAPHPDRGHLPARAPRPDDTPDSEES